MANNLIMTNAEKQVLLNSLMFFTDLLQSMTNGTIEKPENLTHDDLLRQATAVNNVLIKLHAPGKLTKKQRIKAGIK